jgi:hypothetical protein
MPVQPFAITIDVGSDYESPSPVFVWYQPESLTPVDLSAATAIAYVRADPPGSPDIFAISSTPGANGAIALGGTAGTIAWNFTNEATALLPTGLSDTLNYLWWLIVTIDGVETTVLAGPVYALTQ